MHIPDRERCNWLRDQIETQVPGKYGPSRKTVILDRLMWATNFENFLSQKWTAAKRFGLEGCETLIPGLYIFIDFLCGNSLVLGTCLKVVLDVRLRVSELKEVLSGRLFSQFVIVLSRRQCTCRVAVKILLTYVFAWQV